jgi:hypothetical protein
MQFTEELIWVGMKHVDDLEVNKLVAHIGYHARELPHSPIAAIVPTLLDVISGVLLEFVTNQLPSSIRLGKHFLEAEFRRGNPFPDEEKNGERFSVNFLRQQKR